MSAAPPPGLPGTRPEGVRNEAEAAANVREMFRRIAPRYDLLNHLLSLDIDKLWRRRVARRFSAVLHDPNAKVLDLCCGTGDLALTFRKEAPRGAEITGSDFVPEMLVRARAKASAAGLAVAFIEADALQLPFPDASFDLVSCAFGFRNLANYESGLKEIARVLTPGGSAALLEFAEPPGKVFGAVYRLYFRRVLPILGGLISGNASAYTYLPNSVSAFPSPEALRQRFEFAGFARAQFESWTGGIVTLHTGSRAKAE
jgi:demethylmenaquinone methyltransferase/2-methoxy-6-polyprenyl-1,4-benzoquinol methylase